MQGSMTTDRRIIRRLGSICAAALAIAAAAPLAAQAGPLLSGYGGPGQGNQAILGSTLLGGSGGGSGGGSASSSGSGAEASANPGTAAGSQPSGPRVSGGSRSAHRHAAGALSGTTSAGGLAPRSYPAVESTSGAADTLGLSGADILYISLAAVALAFTGALTKLVARTRTAKGH
jgi:hypothetical protein